MRIGSLFSGIGGLELGLEWAGVGHTVWQVEQDPFCRQVLAKHWPEVQRFEDVREVDEHNLQPVDVICGGYPCQPFTIAGHGRGADDPRHLWPEFARIIGALRPRFAVLENVSRHVTLGFDAVLGDLARLGYDAEWSVIRSCAVGTPFARPRLFVLAYANGKQLGRDRVAGHHPTPDSGRDADRARRPMAGQREQWAQEPRMDRVVDGLPHRVDRNRALGNAVVPHVAEVVGHRLMQLAAQRVEVAA
jgi:DNA (cytosine-5)-methyltransferase 1